MATTAGTPRWTSVVATPAYGSVIVVRAPSQELRTTRRSEPWSAEQVGEEGLVDGHGRPVLVLEEQHAVALVREVAVPDVVHDVVRLVAQGAAQSTRRRRLQPVELDPPHRPHRLDGLIDAPPLGVDVERGEIVGAGDDAEHAHGAGDRRRVTEVGGSEHPHHRTAALAGEEPGRAVEELPRHAEQRRRAVEVEAQPQPVPGRLGVVTGAVVGRTDVVAQQRLGELAAEALGVEWCRADAAQVSARAGAGPAGGPAAGARRGDVEDGPLELVGAERQRERPGRRAAVGCLRPHIEVPVGPWRERHPEVVVDVCRHPSRR